MGWDPERNLAALRNVLGPAEPITAAVPGLWLKDGGGDHGTVTFARSSSRFILYRKTFASSVFEQRPVTSADAFQAAPAKASGEGLVAVMLTFTDGDSWGLLVPPYTQFADALRKMGAHLGLDSDP